VSPPAAEDSARSDGSSRALPWLCFGAATAVAIRLLAGGLPSAFDRLLVGSGAASLLVALLWIAWLALRRGGGWAWAFGIGLWIPYVNLVLAAHYARRHWRDGAAAPGWLALAGLAAQLIVALRMLYAAPPSAL
jgi:hypothetical protein